MPLSVLIAPDKFKGTLTAIQAAKAITRGWKAERPEDRITQLAISDGGDGFGLLLGKLLVAQTRQATTVDAARRPVRSHWWFEPKSHTAVIESANVIGLAMLPHGKFHPFDIDTFGLGKILQRAATAGATRCIVGIGGSATNDGGFGVARALGWRFLKHDGNEIEQWPELISLHLIKPPKLKRLFDKLTVAVDVQNHLLGRSGASHVYGPQKGLGAKDIPLAEAALRRLAMVWSKQNSSASKLPGSGAAGGLGFGMHCFAGAKIESGFELFSGMAKLPQLIRRHDLVITGEGTLDRQTVMGKGVGELAKMAKNCDCDCYALAGKIENEKMLSPYFNECAALVDLTPSRKAEANAAIWLERSAGNLAKQCAI